MFVLSKAYHNVAVTVNYRFKAETEKGTQKYTSIGRHSVKLPSDKEIKLIFTTVFKKTHHVLLFSVLKYYIQHGDRR